MTVQIRMRPEWNPSQLVSHDGRVVVAAASPYDFPAACLWQEDAHHVLATLTYDFPEEEQAELAFENPRMRLFRGKKTGRVLKVEISATDVKEAFDALGEAAEALKQLATASRQANKPFRDAVHLGAMEQALPHVAPFIAERLRELRNESK